MLAILIDPPGLLIGAVIGVTAAALTITIVRVMGFLIRRTFGRKGDD